MTDPTPASDRELESLRAQHVPVEFPTLTGLRCRWSGHAWPCRTASLLARLDEVEADRDRLASLVDRLRQEVSGHFDSPDFGGGFCAECGEEWPCCHGGLAGLLAEMDPRGE